MLNLIDKNILILSPHDDDAILMASSILSSDKPKQKYVYVFSTSDLMDSNKLECDNAYKVYNNVHLIYDKDHTNLDMNIKANREQILTIIDLCKSKEIDIILSTHDNCSHLDHRETEKIAEQASFHLNTWAGIKKVIHLMGEVLKPLNKVDLLLETDPTIKKNAMKSFTIQEGQFPWSEAVLKLNEFRGYQNGAKSFCEAFEIKNSIIQKM